MVLDPRWRNQFPEQRTVLVGRSAQRAVLVLDLDGRLVDARGAAVGSGDLVADVAGWIERQGAAGAEVAAEDVHPALRAEVVGRARWGLRAPKDARRRRRRVDLTLSAEAIARGVAAAERAGARSFSAYVERLLLGGGS